MTHAVLSGHTVEMLQKECDARGVDLVVMASHGRGTMSRLWLGSVADGFVRQASVPVLLVRPDEKAEAPKSFEHSFETLMIPLDGSETDWTRDVRAFGDGLAERTGLPVHLMDRII